MTLPGTAAAQTSPAASETSQRQAIALTGAFLAAANGGPAAQKSFVLDRVDPGQRKAVTDALARLAADGSSTMLGNWSEPGRAGMVLRSGKGHAARILLDFSPDGWITAIGGNAVPLPHEPAPGETRPVSDAELATAIARRVTQAVDRGEFSGSVVVRRHGTILYSATAGYADRARGLGTTLATRFNLGSMDKQFTAVAIGQLIDAGRLDLDARLIDLLPAYPNRAAAERITIRHLLTHRAGLGALFDRPGWDWKLRYRRMAELFPIFASQDLQFEPGERFEYSNEGFIVLGAVIEEVTGMSWYDYVDQNIFRTAGMHDTAYLTDDRFTPRRATGYRFTEEGWLGLGDRKPNWEVLSWRGNSCGGGFSTPGDMLAFLEALREGRLVKPATAALLAGVGAELAQPYAFGFESMVVGSGRTLVGHSGGGPQSGINSDARVIWETGDSFAVMGNFDAPFAQSLGAEIARLLAEMP